MAGGMDAGDLSSMATMAAAGGGKVPGHASVKGDSLKNDKVEALVSPGEIIIPRSIAMGPDAPRRAALFVAQELAKHRKG